MHEVVLRATGNAEDLVLADRLPAELGIEDALVKGRTHQAAERHVLNVKNVEVKDDRILVFASLRGFGEYRYYARAVTAGDFVWPAHGASRMCAHSVYSVHGRGRVEVAEEEDAAVGE